MSLGGVAWQKLSFGAMPAKFRPFMQLESPTLATMNQLKTFTKEAFARLTVIIPIGLGKWITLDHVI
jgi:hypothetical protein